MTGKMNIAAIGTVLMTSTLSVPVYADVKVNANLSVRTLAQPLVQPRVQSVAKLAPGGDVVLPPPVFAERNLGGPPIVYGAANDGMFAASQRRSGANAANQPEAIQKHADKPAPATNQLTAQSDLPSSWRASRSGLDGPGRDRTYERRQTRRSDDWKSKVWGQPD